MSRPALTVWGAAEALHRALSAEALPPGVSAGSGGSEHAARVLLRRLRRDAGRVIERDGAVLAAETLGVSRDTLARWRREGWLSPGAGQTDGA